MNLMNFKRVSTTTKRVSATTAALAMAAQPALAQDLFAAPTNFLTQIQTFVLGPGGILLGGAAIAAAGISAAAPRVPVSWGQFFTVLVVLAIFFGAFGIAGTIQGLSA